MDDKKPRLRVVALGVGGRGGISGDVPSGACAPAVADVGMLEAASFAILDDFG